MRAICRSSVGSIEAGGADEEASSSSWFSEPLCDTGTRIRLGYPRQRAEAGGGMDGATHPCVTKNKINVKKRIATGGLIVETTTQKLKIRKKKKNFTN